MEQNRVIAIIPARGSSKGIPKKNIRLLDGRPLIYYVIKAAKQSTKIEEVYVSTEDDYVAEISGIYGAKVVKRPEELSKDDVPIDPVILHALPVIEKETGKKYDLIVTIQPTSPLLSPATIDKAIEIMESGEYNTLISVKEDTHLYWTLKDGGHIPLYTERKNRQYLDPIYKETGAIIVTTKEIMGKGKRIGDKIYIFEVPKEESIDIDSYEDWWVADNILKKLTIVFRTDGDRDVGLGHVYRAISLANHLNLNHNVTFLMNEDKELGIKKVREYSYPIQTFRDEDTLFERLKEMKVDIVINDILDTEKEYLQKLKNNDYFVVNFEDLGEGSERANIVINALYEHSYPPKNHYYGYKYVCLRDEFYIFPHKEVQKSVKRILITFGGTDPNNLTLMTLKGIEKIKLKSIDITVILGLGYSSKDELYEYVKELQINGFSIEIKEDITMMAKEIYNADIVVTSNGRTVYEVVSIGVPCISISQNEREMRHLFSHESRGIMNLGISYKMSEDIIGLNIKKLVEDYNLRNKMGERLLKFDLRKGIDRTILLILDRYYQWQGDRNGD